MNRTVKIGGTVVVLAVLVFGAFSCGGGGVSPEEYDTVRAELTETEKQLTALQGELGGAAGTQAQFQQVNKELEALKKEYQDRLGENEAMNARYTDLQKQYQDSLSQQGTAAAARYEELNQQYEALKKQYEAATTPTVAVITEEAVEQAIFELINQQRISNGLDLLGWGKNMYQLAKENSRTMAEMGKYQYSAYSFMQEIFWAPGYTSVDSIAEGALLVWQSNQYRYEHGILSKAFKYCAIGAYKSGKIVYITLMASDYP
ncbi:MAG TPA: CAP domain-containing protein [Dehalococcoidales bacterium]|nr:CAP domain-containing protein [Dehalococcoidales bacterium]